MIYAFDSNNVETHILDAEQGHEYHCMACGDNLVINRGMQRAWYFRHISNNTCLSDNNIGCILKLEENDRQICHSLHICKKEDCRFKKSV